MSEERMRSSFDAGDLRAVTNEALTTYGPEILGLLCSLHRDEDEASDAFSLFAERLWTSLARFEWKCSLRTWAYVLARRAYSLHQSCGSTPPDHPGQAPH